MEETERLKLQRALNDIEDLARFTLDNELDPEEALKQIIEKIEGVPYE